MKGESIACGGAPAGETADAVERLAALFDAHYGRLYRLARRLTSNSDDALDLVQETFLRAARSACSIPHGTADEEAWLVRVLINIRRDQWRRISIRERHRGKVPDRAAVIRAMGEPESALVRRAAIWRALDMLAPRRRAVVVMKELEGLSAGAIASLLGISRITVRWHLSMGRRDLLRLLKPYIGGKNE
ncbi:MAG: RNA polymerase sigma factor [Acidobacteriia bacterium]|nr:RNA polymerase sigma factor [Terriglobia bacterium]